MDAGVDPKYMGIGPAYTNLKVMERAGLKVKDIDVFECNEAFAAQNLSVIKEMEEITGEKIDMEKWNQMAAPSPSAIQTEPAAGVSVWLP